MKKNTILQVQGFTATKPLWIERTLFELHQFPLPPLENLPNVDPEREFPELKKNHVLGKRAETFFQLVIKASGRYKLLTANLQIAKEKITLGEIDFILQDLCSDKIFHVELVYKFYIYDPSLPVELQRWIGPNRRDSLLRKISRLKEHQLPLLYREETKERLKLIDIDYRPIEQQVCFLANLFVPKTTKRTISPLINNKCISGYWIYYREFTKELYGSNYFFTPKKPDWPILPENNNTWYSFSDITPVVKDLIFQERAPLIWMKTSAGEYERFFIVWW